VIFYAINFLQYFKDVC